MSIDTAATSETILITGATGAIGGALALAYARPGVKLILQGRKHERLHEVKLLCENQGAQVLIKAVDVRHHEEYNAWLQHIAQEEVLDLVMINAGMNTHTGPEGEPEPWEEVKALVDINILAVMATVHATLPAMRIRKKGQIVLMSSLAAYFGLALTPSYSASKAAIKAYGEALQGWLRADGIKIHVIFPGYVTSEMCNNMPGPKPFLWTAERAAAAIKKAVANNKSRYSFPFPLNLGAWCLSILRPGFSQWILSKLKYSH